MSMSLNDNRDEMDYLERLMDTHGTTAVLEAISTLCDEKAEHLREAWGDEVGAKRWQRAARRVEALVSVKGGLPT